MYHTTKKALVEHIKALGVTPKTDIVVHSSLFAFGRLEGGAPTVYDALRECVGNEATIVVPTYTFQTSPEVPYQLDMPSQGVGAFSEYVRKLPEAIRSKCPIHNHAAVGPKAHLLASNSSIASFGHDSDFDIFYQNDFSLLLLGCSFNVGGTYLHHLEALYEVPYREMLFLERSYKTEDGDLIDCKCPYYARIDDEWEQNFDVVIPELEEQKKLTKVPAFFGVSYYSSLRSLHGVVGEMLEQDKYCLVKKAGE